MVHAGHSLPLPPLKVDTLLRRAPRLLSLNNRWLIAPLLATDAMADGPLELCNMSKVLVDKCQLPHILTEELRVLADSALDPFKLRFQLFQVSPMPRALLLQVQLPSILRPLIPSNLMEVVFSTVPADSITTLLLLLVGDPLAQANTGLLETLGALAGESLVTSELLLTATAESHGIPTLLLLDLVLRTKYSVIMSSTHIM